MNFKTYQKPQLYVKNTLKKIVLCVLNMKEMENKFNNLDMINFLKWVNVRCELTEWQGQYLFKGMVYNEEEIFNIYIESYYEKP